MGEAQGLTDAFGELIACGFSRQDYLGGAMRWMVTDGDHVEKKEIVLRIQARYRAFALYETAMLGMLAQSTGWATASRECVETAALFHWAMKWALLVRVSTMPMTTMPPMPKNITTFWTVAKILMPKTTNMKPTTLKQLASRKVIHWLLTTQLAAPFKPR